MKFPFVSRKKLVQTELQLFFTKQDKEHALQTMKCDIKGLIWDKKGQVLDSLNDKEIDINQYDACIVILEELEKEII